MLPDKRKSNASSVLRRALARFRAHQQEPRIAIEQAQSTVRPPRLTRHRCAVTGERWLTEWRAGGEDGRYKSYRKIRNAQDAAEAGRGGKAGSATAQAGGTFDLSEFEWPNEPCPGCGDDRLSVFCRCGEIVCGGRTLFYKKARDFFRCDESCGKKFEVAGNVTKVAAETQRTPERKALPRNTKTKALPSPTRALPHSKRRQK